MKDIIDRYNKEMKAHNVAVCAWIIIVLLLYVSTYIVTYYGLHTNPHFNETGDIVYRTYDRPVILSDLIGIASGRIFIITLICIIPSLVLFGYFPKPTKSIDFPYFRHQFDVTGVKLPKIDNYIQIWLNDGGFDYINNHQNAYIFDIYRNQTMYRQENYIKIPYKIRIIVDFLAYSFNNLLNLNENLSKIGYSTTLEQYNSKEQRKLMTPELRKQIMNRSKSNRIVN